MLFTTKTLIESEKWRSNDNLDVCSFVCVSLLIFIKQKGEQEAIIRRSIIIRLDQTISS